MRSRNYFESIIQDEDGNHNEVYTNRIKCLKHNARAAVVLKHQTLQQSFLLADVVGATVAGLAMCVAIGGIYLCYRFSRYSTLTAQPASSASLPHAHTCWFSIFSSQHAFDGSMLLMSVRSLLRRLLLKEPCTI